MFQIIKRFVGNRSGQIALISALLTPVLFGAVGLAADYASYYKQASRLQQSADAAALASVKELSLSGSAESVLKDVAQSYANASFFSGKADRLLQLQVETDVRKDKGEVQVNLSLTWAPFFAHFLNDEVMPIKVSSTAGLAGQTATCIVGLMQPQTFAQSSIHMDNRSKIKADGCAVYSNSVSKYGLRADDDAHMVASTICSAGGVLTLGWRGNAQFEPYPILDCPKLEDPLRDRANPNYGGCDFSGHVAHNFIGALEPGVYCGGLQISGTSNVTLSPGLYVIKDGPMNVQDASTLKGTGVTFFLTGRGSTVLFEANTTIDLAAMESGSTAGLLFFEDRTVPHSFEFNPLLLRNFPPDVRVHRVTSNNARNLLGTLYMPNSILLIDADAPIADASAYTAIVTGRLWLREGPILTLNSDYDATSVPVPSGLVGTEPRLLD